MYSCEQLTSKLYINKVLFEKRLRQKSKTSVKQKLSSKLEERKLTITSYIHNIRIFSCKFTLKMIASNYFIHKI